MAMKKEEKIKRDHGFVKSQRDRYREMLEHDIKNLEKAGCRGGMFDSLKDRLACIEWLEANDDPRPLDSETMDEYTRYRDDLR